jgi:uncharacterized protein YeeX (DUF496 family)
MIDLNININEDDEQLNPPSICYYPGGFKPPHEGHFEAAKDLASRTYVTKVIIIIGHKIRDGITKEQSKKIWDLYLTLNPMAKVSVKISDNSSPIKDIFKDFDNDLKLKAYIAGSKEDVEVQDYFGPLKKAFETRVMPLIIEEKAITDNKRLSGTQVRELVTQLKQSVLKLRSTSDKNSTGYSKARNEYLNNFQLLEGCFPESVIQKGGFKNILQILGIPVLNADSLQEMDNNVIKGQDIIIKIPYNKTTSLENFLNTNLIPFEYSQHNFDGNERRMVIPNLGNNEDGHKTKIQVIDFLNKKNIPHDLEEDLFTIKWWKKSLTEFKLDVEPTVSIKDVNKEELKKGIKVEKEHTTDTKTAARIALDHLSEDPKYYTKLEKAGLEETLKPQKKTDNILEDFIDFATEALELKTIPEIEFSDDEELARSMHSLGAYQPTTGKLLVFKGPRLTADILRTLAHELVHRKQDEFKKLGAKDGATGSPIENEANAAAGILLRKFGEYRPEIFEQLKDLGL